MWHTRGRPRKRSGPCVPLGCGTSARHPPSQRHLPPLASLAPEPASPSTLGRARRFPGCPCPCWGTRTAGGRSGTPRWRSGTACHFRHSWLPERRSLSAGRAASRGSRCTWAGRTGPQCSGLAAVDEAVDGGLAAEIPRPACRHDSGGRTILRRVAGRGRRPRWGTPARSGTPRPFGDLVFVSCSADSPGPGSPGRGSRRPGGGRPPGRARYPRWPTTAASGSREARNQSPAVRTSSMATAMKIRPSVMAAWLTWFAIAQVVIGPGNQCTEP